ncbi:MAG: hypothetical protein GY805_00150 [Chloroflexi bacterium]|nr:hypothetical protein [Chloroflexota bacterium]
MMSSDDNSTILYADQEHVGLRTAVFILLFASLLLAYFAIRGLFGAFSPDDPSDFAPIIACGGAFPVALVVVWLAEMMMKRYWTSGRSITLTTDGIQAKAVDEDVISVNRASDFALIFYHFSLRGWQRSGRERRVPQNWLCLTVQLSAGKTEIIVYAFLPKNKADKWLKSPNKQMLFHEIFPKEVYDSSFRSRMSGPSRPKMPTAVITGKNGSYWLAERRRWQEGFELPAKEFKQFMDHLQNQLL